MFYDFFKLMFVCKETSKKRLYTKIKLKIKFFFSFFVPITTKEMHLLHFANFT